MTEVAQELTDQKALLVQMPEMRRLLDYEHAVSLLLRAAQDAGPYGKGVLARAAEYQASRLDGYFRETPRIDTEKQALALVKGIAQELDKAAGALKIAAESLKGAGKVLPANQAYVAHMAARNAARQWLQA
jgi:hypothetical protein